MGAGLLPVQEPLKPKPVLALVPSVPFQSTLRAVACAPLWVTAAPHAWVTC